MTLMMKTIDIINLVREHAKSKQFNPHGTFTSNLTAYPKKLSIETTKYCPVGCSFCMYESNLTGEMAISSNEQCICLNRLIKLINMFNLKHLIITGGGDPLYDLDSFKCIINNTKSNIISINTSGFWCKSKKITKTVYEVLRNKKNISTVEIRFSIDNFHQARVSLRDIINFIENITNRFHNFGYKINISFRTNLIVDSSVDSFIDSYTIDIDDNFNDNYLWISLYNGYKAKLYFAPIFFNKKIEFLRKDPSFDYVGLIDYMLFASNFDGIFRPFLYKDSFNLTVKPTHQLINYSGDSQVTCAYPYNDINLFIHNLLKNKILLAGIQIGLNGLFKIACGIDKLIYEKLIYSNDFTSIIPLIRSSPFRSQIIHQASTI